MLSDAVKTKGQFFFAMGRTPEEVERPLVGIANSQNELVPGHIHLDEIAAVCDIGLYYYPNHYSHIRIFIFQKYYRNPV